MQTFFFHWRRGTEMLRDEEGRELANLSSVIAAALVEARAMIGQDVQEGYIRLDQSIDVEDQNHRVVHRLGFGDAVRILGDGGDRSTHAPLS